tara:strand:+ start:634 stop:843 length:210 start_codon:yes stop_codon:yes gene_type:complete
MVELIIWAFSIYIAWNILSIVVCELFGSVKTVNQDVEYLIKEKIWEKDSKTTNTFDERFSIHDPFNFTD